MDAREQITHAVHRAGIWTCGVMPFDPSLVFPGSRKLSLIPENCRTVIVCVFPYFTGDTPERNVSLYAVSRDYHIILREYLTRICGILADMFPKNRFVSFADSSPVNEVLAAAKAGLGCIGANRTFITPEYGSYVFLGEILTDLEVVCESTEVCNCEMCGRCVSACPAGALLPEGGVDAARCISSISQKKGEFTPEELALFDRGRLVWGCDVCQEVCPHNAHVTKTYIPEFYVDRRPTVTDENFSDGFEQRAYAWRGEGVIRRNMALKNIKTAE